MQSQSVWSYRSQNFYYPEFYTNSCSSRNVISQIYFVWHPDYCGYSPSKMWILWDYTSLHSNPKSCYIIQMEIFFLWLKAVMGSGCHRSFNPESVLVSYSWPAVENGKSFIKTQPKRTLLWRQKHPTVFMIVSLICP